MQKIDMLTVGPWGQKLDFGLEAARAPHLPGAPRLRMRAPLSVGNARCRACENTLTYENTLPQPATSPSLVYRFSTRNSPVSWPKPKRCTLPAMPREIQGCRSRQTELPQELLIAGDVAQPLLLNVGEVFLLLLGLLPLPRTLLALLLAPITVPVCARKHSLSPQGVSPARGAPRDSERLASGVVVVDDDQLGRAALWHNEVALKAPA